MFEEGKIPHQRTTFQLCVVKGLYFLSHLEIVKDITKEILRQNLIKTGGKHYLVLNKISTL